MIPAFDIDSAAYIWFDSRNGINDKNLISIDDVQNKEKQEFSENEKLNRNVQEITFKDAVFASTTTPNLFGSLSYLSDDDKHRFIDGGEGNEYYNNNNPTFSLIVEALQQGYKKENIRVISLGAGALPDIENTNEKIKHDSTLYWKEPLGNKIISDETEKTHRMVVDLLGESNYVRLQPVLPEGKFISYTGCSYEENE